MPVLLTEVGVRDGKQQLLYNAILNVISFVAATIGARFVDRLGRRPVLLICTSLFVVWWVLITVLTALYTDTGSEASAGTRAAIAMMYIFGITYSFSYTPLQALYPVECLAYETRAKGMGIYNLIVNIAAFFNTYAIPTVLDKVHWRFYFVYIAWDVFEVIYIYFMYVPSFFPEFEKLKLTFLALLKPKGEHSKKSTRSSKHHTQKTNQYKSTSSSSRTGEF